MKKKKKSVIGLLLMCCMLALMPLSASAKTKTSVSTMTVGKAKVESSYQVKSSNRKIVDVKKQGKKYRVVPKKVGEATLSYYKGKKLTKKVYVLVTSKNTFKYNTSKLTLKQGSSKTYKATAYKKCKVSYSSSNKKIVTVSSKGSIKGIRKGSATVTAKITYRGKTVKTFKKKVTVTPKTSSSSSSSTSGGTLVKIRTVPSYYSTPRFTPFNKSKIKVYGTYKKGSKTYEKEIKNYTHNFKPTKGFGWGNFTITAEGKKFKVSYYSEEESFMRSWITFEKEYMILGEPMKEEYITVLEEYERTPEDGLFNDTYKVKAKPLDWTWVPLNYHGSKGVLEVKVKDSNPRGYEWWVFEIPCYSGDSYKSMKATLSKSSFAPGEDITKSLKVTAVTLKGQTVEVKDYKTNWVSQTRPGSYNVEVTVMAYNDKPLTQMLTVTVQ